MRPNAAVPRSMAVLAEPEQNKRAAEATLEVSLQSLFVF